MQAGTRCELQVPKCTKCEIYQGFTPLPQTL